MIFAPGDRHWKAAMRLPVLGLLSVAAMAAEPVPQSAEPAATPVELDDELTEVLVTAREPRYVAPTRRDKIGRIWVPVYINEKGPFRLVLDSGATRSAVNPNVASTLSIPLDRSPPVLLRGITGSAVRPTIQVESVSVGDLWVGTSNLPIVEDAFGGAEGLLGMQGMQDKRIYIDFRNDFINVSRSRNRRAEFGFEALPFMEDRLNLLVVRAKVGGLPVRAIIDTGAQATVGNGALKFRLESQINRRPKTKDEITGATGATQTGVGVKVEPIVLGKVTIRDAHVTFGELHIFDYWNLDDEPAIVIGMDILGLLDTLVIDYQRQELHIKPLNKAKLLSDG
jgi:predicted aspartyl protease